jgi:DNA-3-methyladenine glycosylase II
MADQHYRWSEADAHLSGADPLLAPIISRNAPCTMKPDADIFLGLLDAIVSQQLSVKASATIFGRFKALFPNGVTPSGVIETSIDDIRACGFSRGKAAYVHDLCAHVLDGRLELDHLDTLPDDEVVTELTAVKGIGRWTAEMILIFHLNRPDILPLDDLGIREAFKRLYNLDDRPGPDEMTLIAEPWRPWRSVGSWYLWRILDNEPLRAQQAAADGPMV